MSKSLPVNFKILLAVSKMGSSYFQLQKLSSLQSRPEQNISITSLGNISWYTLLVSDIRLSNISSVSTNIKNPVLLIGENLPFVYDLWLSSGMEIPLNKKYRATNRGFYPWYVCQTNFLKHSDDFAAGIRAQWNLKNTALQISTKEVVVCGCFSHRLYCLE